LEEAGNAEGEIKERITSFDGKVRSFLEEIRENETESVKDEVIRVKNDVKTLKAKIIVIGAPAVGKTSLILRFTSNAFTRTYLPTLGVQLSQKKVRYGNYIVELSIWDLAGHEKFNVLLSHYYKGSEAEIIVFDLTRPDTYRGIEKWYKDIQKNLGRAPVGIIIGNKSDLEGQRSTAIEEVQALQDELGLKYFETSALKRSHVEEAFLEIARILVEGFEKKYDEYQRENEKTG
jgi:Ras-related protein Rab-8A